MTRVSPLHFGRTVQTLAAVHALIAGAMVVHTATADPVEMSEDSDGDGLLDAWEFENFGNLRDQSHPDDPDGDGVDNLAEMQAGTNPNDPADL